MTPPASKAPLEAALSQNPHLTSLPAPSPSVLAPSDLTLTTGTAELLRLPEVQAAIKSDFILLPCDLICDIPGEALLESWMVSQAALSGSGEEQGSKHGSSQLAGLRGEKSGRRGGFGVWYQTRDREESVKGEVADFVATAALDQNEAPAVYPPVDGHGSIRYNLSKLVYAMPMDSLKEKMEEDKGLLIRHSLINKHARVKLLTTYRDAHIYLFPYWVKNYAKKNEKFQSISEDLVGWWAKAEWQEGLGEKLGLREILEGVSNDPNSPAADNASHDGDAVEDEVDLLAMSTTKAGGRAKAEASLSDDLVDLQFASRVNTMASESDLETKSSKSKLTIPPMFAYLQSSLASAPLVRRVDSSALLLSVSLKLAKLESVEEAGRTAASPFAHAAKIAYPAGIAQRCTVTKQDCLIAENVTVEEKCVIKETVIGANCQIQSGARLTRCLVMDGAVVGPRCQLTGCIIGRRSKIGRECVLKDCEVQDGNAVPDETDAKNEKFMVFEGLDTEDGDEESMSFDGDDSGKTFDEGGADLGF